LNLGFRRTLHRQRFEQGVLGDGYDVVVCGDCGAGFADGIPSQSELDSYYAERSKYSYDGASGAESIYDRRRFELIADQVAPFLSSGDARILDIGCATGGLLSVFKQRGYRSVLGADPASACAAAAVRLHRVEVRTATLGQLATWTERFDIILMVGVLEHLRDVRPALRTIANLLNPGGLLFVAVPDVDGLAASRNAPFQQFSMEHVNFFSVQSLDRTIAAEGFAPLRHWQDMIEWSEGVTEPVLAGLFRLETVQPSNRPTVRPSNSSTVPDSITEPALNRYIASSTAADLAIREKIEALVQSRRPILIWGAGALTRRLLASTPLVNANIAAFVDSSSHLQGSLLAGKTILAPAQLAERTEPILICSVAFEREIARTIRDRLKLPNELITLSSGRPTV